jgi:hypothetical protein
MQVSEELAAFHSLAWRRFAELPSASRPNLLVFSGTQVALFTDSELYYLIVHNLSFISLASRSICRARLALCHSSQAPSLAPLVT